MKVGQLIQELQKLPPEAEVYFDEPGCGECDTRDGERDVDEALFEDCKDAFRCDGGGLAYPNGRVRLV